MGNLSKHLMIIHNHRKYVCRMCFKLGLYWQGMTHDLSKYSPTELSIYKFYDGHRSPHAVAREQFGYSPSWNHHKNYNKHHWEYWLDNQDSDDFTGIKIPYKYVVEMICDMIGAGMAYNYSNWTTRSPLDYYEKNCKGKRIMHKDSTELFETLIYKLSEFNTLAEFVAWYKNNKKDLIDKYEHTSLLNK